ncbi:hypothetical protein LPJ57_009042, partial [Coemansia sp. RSA 486]
MCLELEHLLLGVAEILQDAADLALAVVGRLGTADQAHHRWRSAHADKDAFSAGSRHVFLHKLLGHIASVALPITRRCLVDDIMQLELLRMVLSQTIELRTQNNVILRLVGKHQSQLGVVAGILKDMLDQLQHRCDSGAASNHADLLESSSLVRILGDRTLDLQNVAWSQR